jgi:hypothetical protein
VISAPWPLFLDKLEGCHYRSLVIYNQGSALSSNWLPSWAAPCYPTRAGFLPGSAAGQGQQSAIRLANLPGPAGGQGQHIPCRLAALHAPIVGQGQQAAKWAGLPGRDLYQLPTWTAWCARYSLLNLIHREQNSSSSSLRYNLVRSISRLTTDQSEFLADSYRPVWLVCFSLLIERTNLLRTGHSWGTENLFSALYLTFFYTDRLVRSLRIMTEA